MKKEKSILLVDSDQAFREGVVNLLLVSGFGKVQVAGSIKEALQKVSRYYFDLILIDLFMPRMSGLNLAQQVQKQQADAEIILLVDDQYESLVNNTVKPDIESPTLLNSQANCILPQLLSEKQIVLQTLQKVNWIPKNAAEELGIDPRNFNYSLKKHNISINSHTWKKGYNKYTH